MVNRCDAKDDGHQNRKEDGVIEIIYFIYLLFIYYLFMEKNDERY